MMNKPQQQLAFIAYIQRMLAEGEFVATYKFALLHAIADVCVERPLTHPDDELVITVDELAEKFVLLYWYHALPFSDTQDGTHALLKQSTGSQSTLINALYQCHQENIRNYRQLKESARWTSLQRTARRTLLEGPLWRLQILSKQSDCLLYPHTGSKTCIKLNTGIADSFRRFYDLVVYLAKQGWIQKIQSIKYNQALLGGQSQLSEFLFGVDRNAMNKAKPVLIDIQLGNCFYCKKPLLNDTTDVDHFIPFSRYSTDLGHNFVAAHRTCNHSKRDYLAAEVHRSRWQEQNLVKHTATLAKEFSNYFYCNADKSRAISDWAYSVAQANGAKLWLSKDQFTDSRSLNLSAIHVREATHQGLAANDRCALNDDWQEVELYYFPNLKIACGHFKTGHPDNAAKRPAPTGYGKLSPERHFLARASGNSMNGGKQPIQDGDLLLLEWIDSVSAGSLRNQTVAIERQDTAGDNQYLLRDVKRMPDGQYRLTAKNPDYLPLPADATLRTFARLKAVLSESFD
ncbi:MAG: HNH endonuclease [Hahellaceae bacterium]|nr:HNH endonuclease [Hahellaceae bacterium]